MINDFYPRVVVASVELPAVWTNLMAPPIAIDIDGTMTRPAGGVDARLIDRLRDLDTPVLLATGKSFPYPVALCQFIGIPPIVVAENGGIVLVEEELVVDGEDAAARRVAARLLEDGYPGGWPEPDLHNRWRETELSVDRAVPYDVELFEVVGRSYAVANAADVAKDRADVVTEEAYGSGALEALELILQSD